MRHVLGRQSELGPQQQQIVGGPEARMLENPQRATPARMLQPRLEREHLPYPESEALRDGDIFLGLAKALAFGAIVSAVGCLRGLQTQEGPSAVGVSTTRAVVASIVLIVLADAVFAVLFYYLKK